MRQPPARMRWIPLGAAAALLASGCSGGAPSTDVTATSTPTPSATSPTTATAVPSPATEAYLVDKLEQAAYHRVHAALGAAVTDCMVSKGRKYETPPAMVDVPGTFGVGYAPVAELGDTWKIMARTEQSTKAVIEQGTDPSFTRALTGDTDAKDGAANPGGCYAKAAASVYGDLETWRTKHDTLDPKILATVQDIVAEDSVAASLHEQFPECEDEPPNPSWDETILPGGTMPDINADGDYVAGPKLAACLERPEFRRVLGVVFGEVYTKAQRRIPETFRQAHQIRADVLQRTADT